MKKRRHIERAHDATFSQKHTDTVTLEGETLPSELRRAIALVEMGHSICRITHKNKKVAIVRARWIPLIEKLEAYGFSHRELVALDESLVFDEEYTAKKRSEEIVEWAKALGEKQKKGNT